MCDFDAIPISLIQRSAALNGDFEVVAPHGCRGSEGADYSGLDVHGKLVLTRNSPQEVYHEAVRQRGAAGILFFGMGAGGRTAADIPDGRQYSSFWWAGVDRPDAGGFVLTPRQGKAIRDRIECGEQVRVRVRIDARFYDGHFEVVDAFIPGTGGDQEVLLLSHLCHPAPGANDNASGAGALIEAAATLAGLLEEGAIERPQRGIRLLWVPEMLGTYAWLAQHEDEVRAGRWVCGLNLDMIGADQLQTGGAWQLVQLPNAGAAFADHLLSWLREPFLPAQNTLARDGGWRHEEASFGAGSDHYILSDPSVDIPTPMLIQWPDLYYHSSEDTADRVSPASLAANGGLAAAYALWVAAAGKPEARWLAHWMSVRLRERAGKRAAKAAAALAAGAAGDCEHYASLHAFYLEQDCRALGSLARLAPDMQAEVTAWQEKLRAGAEQEAEWAGIVGEPPASPRSGGLVPVRRWPGPVDLSLALGGKAEALRAEMLQLGDDYHHVSDLLALLQYWADGRRTIMEIAELVALETGYDVHPLAERFFRLLATLECVTLHESGGLTLSHDRIGWDLLADRAGTLRLTPGDGGDSGHGS